MRKAPEMEPDSSHFRGTPTVDHSFIIGGKSEYVK